MRPFGYAADLDVDFGQPDRPGLVTTLLANCSDQHDDTFWWSQPVGVRTATLLRLVSITEQSDDISLSARCGATGCGDSFEFTLPLLSLPSRATDAAPMRVRLDDDRTLTLRRPTGEDLRHWRTAHTASRDEAVRAMVDSLLLAGELRPHDEAAVSASITAQDPLVDFAVSCQCPTCRAPSEVEIDLEALALRRLAGRQSALLQDIHRFARSYGWTESEVLAVPAWRRARYLRLIEDQR